MTAGGTAQFQPDNVEAQPVKGTVQHLFQSLGRSVGRASDSETEGPGFMYLFGRCFLISIRYQLAVFQSTEWAPGHLESVPEV